MPARDEPSTIEGIAHALLLARQDVEAVLANEPAWLALGAIGAGRDGTEARERDLISARLALVPAYRSLQRINEALEGLARFAAMQTASRDNNWAGEPPTEAPSLLNVRAELERARETDAPLSNWLPKGGGDGDEGARPAVDLDRLVALIRKGTATRGPQPLKGLLASLAAVAEPAPPVIRPALRPTPEAPVFPETTSQAARHLQVELEAVDLVPIVDDGGEEAAIEEIVVDEAAQEMGQPAALDAPGSAPVHLTAQSDPTDAFARINRMEAEVAGLAAQSSRRSGTGFRAAGGAGVIAPAGEATVEIVRTRDAARDASANERAGLDHEAIVEIVIRPGSHRR